LSDHSGARLTGLRLRTWQDSNLSAGKWIGVVMRDSSDKPAIVPSHFPDLRPGGRACVFLQTFREEAPGLQRAEAYYQLEESTGRRRMHLAVLCHHEPAHPMPPAPVEIPVAGQCPAGALALVSFQPDSGASIDLSFRIGIDGFAASLKQAADSAYGQKPIAGFTELLDASGGAGPWFPCTSAVCCRVS
jgi:hypothetical protein